MKVKQLKLILESMDDNSEITVSSDEELNTIFKKFEICLLDNTKKETYCIFGLSGTEMEEDYDD